MFFKIGITILAFVLGLFLGTLKVYHSSEDVARLEWNPSIYSPLVWSPPPSTALAVYDMPEVEPNPLQWLYTLIFNKTLYY